MDFPQLVPSSRQYTPGDWPVGTFKAMDGYEVRMLFGSKRTGMKLQLQYDAIKDTEAELFLQHYAQQLGTFSGFHFVDPAKVKAGWGGDYASIGAQAADSKWRYEGPPQVVNVRPGVSNLTVTLVGVLI